MKKAFNIFLLILISLTSLFTSVFTLNNNKLFNNLNYQLNKQTGDEVIIENQDRPIWGSKALRYYLYKNSSISTNEKHKNIYEFIINTFIKKALVDKQTHKLDDKNIEFRNEQFKYSFLSSAIVVSNYATTKEEEFFAESFNRYISSNDKQKNTVYYLLDHFFNNVYKQLKELDLNTYLTLNKWNKIKEIIDKDFTNRKQQDNFFVYDLFLDNSKINKKRTDLGYEKNTEFGFFSTSYIKDVLKNISLDIYGTYKAPSIGLDDIRLVFDTNTLNDLLNKRIDQIDQSIQIENKNKTILDILQTFSNAQLYNVFNNKNNTDNSNNKNYYKDFNHLDNYWKQNSLFNFKLHSAINLKKAIDNLDNKSFIGTELFNKNELKDNLLKLFNKVESITDNKFKDIFINLIFTTHKKIIIRDEINREISSESVNGVAQTNIDRDKDTKPVIYSFVVVRTLSFSINNTNQENFLKSWFASNHTYQTINHEFGHILDYYLAQSKKQAKENNKNFNQSFWVKHQARNLYSYDKKQAKIVDLKLLLIGLVISLVIILIIWVLSYIFKKYNLKEKILK
ncbi:hypothetical protein NX779_03125 [Mycoplasma cottewii]|uniref:Uncharacterized protein n=1 Tax=Mycoplasma cottewii TaxID=51364 RepID=A0ABY5TVS8_9MOLU|nr:hypothetical protein [Mycoplasma cottewii]UWD34783.1 hypothetical protein NX779_03125 [Mycoplasma cottewii]